MKKNFKKCLKMLLEHEGGFVNHPEDPGGATNLGVTKATYQAYVGRHVSMQEMRDLTVEDVEPIYRKRYADAVKFDELSSGVDWATLDFAVNSGPGRAAKALQGCVGATQDGAIGPKTLATVKKADPQKVIKDLHRARQEFYEGLKTFKTFGKGWTRRNAETLEQALHLVD